MRLGSFVLDAPAARGGSGVVWRATRADGRRAAVKVLRADVSDPHHAHTLRNEVLAAAALDHPHVVRVYEHGTVDEAAHRADASVPVGSPWLAMEWCDGGDLAQRRGRLDWPAFRNVLVDLLGALGHAHARGVVHRDVKPANVLFADGALRLCDFGMAIARGGRPPNALPGGTRAFMAPEQVGGRAHEQGPWTDLYAVGALTWSMLSPSHPWDPDAADDLPFVSAVVVPDGLEAWLRRLLARRPQDRPAFAADAARALARVDAAARREPSAGRTRRASGRAVELRRLAAALRQVRESGRARAVLLMGPTGIGKSWLAEAFCTATHERGQATWLRADHHPAPEAADGLRGALLRRFDLTGGDRSAVEARLEAAPLSARERSGLVDLLVPAGADDVSRTARERHLLVQRQLQRLGTALPVVLWLDDLQWGLDTMEIVRHVLRTRLALPTPVLFVGTVRTDALRNRPAARERLGLLTADPAVETVDVGPLGLDALRGLGRRLGLASGLVGHLTARVGGNPKLFFATVDRWEAAGRLVDARGGRALRGTPEPVEAALAEGFEAEAQDLVAGRAPGWVDALRVAAVLGTVVESVRWVAVCKSLGVAATTDVPETLARRGMAAPQGPLAWRFSHAGLREAVLAAMPVDDRRRMHLAVAAALPSPGTADEQARRGRQLGAAGRHAEAMTELVEAARRHHVSGDPLAAEALLDEAEASAHEVGLPDAGLIAGLLRCRVWRDHHRFDEALALAERLRDHLDARSHLGRARVERVVGAILWASGRRSDARTQLALAAEEAARSGDAAVEVECTAAAGLLRLELGDLAGGEATLLRAIARADRSGQSDLGLDAWIGLTNARVQRGDLAGAGAALQRAVEAATRTGNRPALARCCLLRGELERAASSWERAEAAYLDAAIRFDEIGSPAAGPAWLNLGLVAAATGHWVEAARRMRFVRGRDWPPVSDSVRAVAALALVAAEPAGPDAPALFAEASEAIRRMRLAAKDIAWLAAEVAGRVTDKAVAAAATDLAVGQRRLLATGW